MRDRKFGTMRDCLDVIENSDGTMEDEKWKALAFFLRGMAEAEGVDLDGEMEEGENREGEMTAEEIETGVSDSPRREAVESLKKAGWFWGRWF